MAGRQARPRNRDAGGATVPPPRRGRRTAWAAGLVLAAGLAIAVALRARGSDAPGPAALTPVQAFERGLALAQSGRDLESLPYFERALAAGGAVPVPVRNAYTAALHN